MRAEKQLLLDEIKEKIESSPTFILARYGAVNPNQAADFRVQLQGNGAELEVVKKRVLLQAFKVSGVGVDSALLEGHIGVVFAKQDPVQAIKTVFQFKQENEGLLEVIGGRMDQVFYSAADIETISKLPSKQQMQAELLGLFEAVPSQTLATMESLLTSVIYCLDNKSKN